MRAAVTLLLVTVAAQAQLVAPEVLRYAKAQRQVNQELSRLPSYTCLETIFRATRPSPAKPFKPADTIRLEVALVEGKELYAWPGSRAFRADTPAELIGAGLSGNGDYAVHIRNIFAPQTAAIHYEGEEPLTGLPAYRYAYRLSSVLGTYEIRFQQQFASASAHGSFWLDRDTLSLRQISMIEDNLPDSFPVARVESTISYAKVLLGSDPILLPQSSHVVLYERSGAESRNQMEFTHCRRYVSESAISFGERPTAPPSETPAAAAEAEIPAGLRVPVALANDLTLKSAQIGDPIAATVTADVRRKSRVIIPKGARLTGRLRRLETHADPEPHHIIGLEFDELEWPGAHARFVGDLQEVDLYSGASFLLPGRTSASEHLHFNDRIQTTRRETIFNHDIPGVGTFFLRDTTGKLPRGFPMVWQTLQLAK